jgi:hypothetical protein
MVNLEKILCFIFTLCVIFILNKKCMAVNMIESLINFKKCADDPNWYTIGGDGMKYYCGDIGDSASCYDMDPFQQEGWEKCLKTCGNCVSGSVSIAPMNNLAMYSGDKGETYDKVNSSIDTSRNWVGLDVGDTALPDVRNTITKDEGEDIIDIYDRLNIVEDMYDMLLSSVDSCIDCQQFNQTECPAAYCVFEGGACSVREEQANSGRFRSCRGSDLSCNYTVTQHRSTDSSSTDSSSTDSSSTASSSTDSSTEEADGSTVTHAFVKHYCDEHGVCSILFPTYEFDCNNIPEPRETTHDYPTITYEPIPSLPRKCLSRDNYDDDTDINITPTIDSDSVHRCYTVDSISPREMTIGETSNIVIMDEEVWVTDQPVELTSKSEVSTNCERTLTVRLNEDNTLTLVDGESDVTDLQEIVDNCFLSRTNAVPKDRCYKLTGEQRDTVDGTVDGTVDKLNCATYCNSISPLTKYITIDDGECRCYSGTPTLSDKVVNPSSGECGSEHPIPFLDEGEVVNIQRIRTANIDPDKNIRDMCKQYFLLENSLTHDNDNDISTTDGMSGRTSLFDICPVQCKARGCEGV